MVEVGGGGREQNPPNTTQILYITPIACPKARFKNLSRQNLLGS